MNYIVLQPFYTFGVPSPWQLLQLVPQISQFRRLDELWGLQPHSQGKKFLYKEPKFATVSHLVHEWGSLWRCLNSTAHTIWASKHQAPVKILGLWSSTETRKLSFTFGWQSKIPFLLCDTINTIKMNFSESVPMIKQKSVDRKDRKYCSHISRECTKPSSFITRVEAYGRFF